MIKEVNLNELLNEVNLRNENEIAQEMQDFFSDNQDELIYKCKEKMQNDK